MSNPKQPSNIEPERKAWAPYNFIELPDLVVRLDSPAALPDQDRYDPERFSGRIECELTTSSPLFIRCGMDPKESAQGAESKDKPEFFSAPGQKEPLIPGTSLRGMLRSLVEIASFAKIQFVTGQQLVYRAVGDTTSHGLGYRGRLMHEDDPRNLTYSPLMKGGYMHGSGLNWHINPATEIGGVTWARIHQDQKLFDEATEIPGCKNARTLYVRLGPYDYQEVIGGHVKNKYTRVTWASAKPADGASKVALAISGWMPKKRTEAVIYEKDPRGKPLEIDESLIEMYREQISPEQAELLGADGVLVEGQPVFYITDPKNPTKVAFFGHCMMFRLPYPRSPLDFIPPELRDEADIDLSEAIFGFSKSREDPREPKAKTYAGRVNISDALILPDQKDIWLMPKGTLTPRILGGPKPTTFQHYLVQTQPNPLPTGGRFKDGTPRTELKLSDYAAPTPGGTVIRGHKAYWHKGAVSAEDLAEDKPVKEGDKQHTHIKPLRAGVKFHFQMTFANLSPEELGSLLWVLQIAGDERYRLKLGMGKPLGMGAVKIDAALKLINRKERYSALFKDGAWNEGVGNGEALRDKAVTAFETHVLRSLHLSAAGRLADHPRIQQLLAMLSWPGPDRAQTRYMEIEHLPGKVNEYKNRPVLPNPQDVLGKKQGGAVAPKPARPAEPSGATPAGYQRGVVKNFGLGPKTSFGFITPEGGGADVFVHINDLPPGVKTLEPGQRVQFKIGQGMKGPQAKEIKLI